MTNEEFSMEVFGTKSKYLMRYNSEDRITVNELVNICNRFHISFSHFISLDESDIFTNDLSKYIIPAQIFAPITFHAENIQHIYGSDGLAGGITKSAFSKQMGISPKSIYLYYSNPSNCTMKLKMLFGICNRYGIDINSFIEDGNIPLPENRDLLQNTDATTRLNKEVISLRNLIAENRLKIIELSNENERLKATRNAYNYNTVSDEATTYTKWDHSTRMWTFNKALLESLPIIEKTSKNKFFKKYGMCNPASQYNNGNIQLVMMINICNDLHISARHFFIRKDISEQPIMSIDYYRQKDFSDVSFRTECFKYISGKNWLSGMSVSEMLDRIGYSKTKYHKLSCGEIGTIRVEDMVELCNALKVSPFCFINDPNKVNIYSITQSDFLLEENSMMRIEIIRLKEKLKKAKSNE